MRATLLFLFTLILPVSAGAATIVVTDADMSGDVTWTADNTYILVGRVFVEDGETLTIEAGTVIKGRAAADPSNAAALVVARGGKIFAEGTVDAPIIFTAEVDDVLEPEDLDITDRGLWGGVIILGKATTNTATGEGNVEGIDVSDPRGAYGCDTAGTGGVTCNDDDDSGVFRYVSIRHGGAKIADDNEINGLTMGGVGRGTVIEYVEVFANLDDGFEWFGGTVDSKYLAAIAVGDDAFDYDEGFRGRGQFWFSIQFGDDAGSGGEHDGGTKPEDGMPYAQPVVHNATYIGVGANSTGAGAAKNDWALNLRDNAGGEYYNSVFTGFFGRAVSVEDQASGEDSWARFGAGQLALTNNVFFDFGGANASNDLFVVRNSSGEVQTASDATFDAYMVTNNYFEDPQLNAVCRALDFCLDPRPQSESRLWTLAQADYPAEFFAPVEFIGAFGGTNWLAGWSAASEYALLTENAGTANEDDTVMPVTAALAANYPNPFAAQTTIAFELDTAQRVTLAVFDVLGREVARLVDGVQPAGRNEVTFAKGDLPAGTYVYQLRTEGGTVASKRMVLVR